MLDTVFYFILNMSIAACFVIAVLLLVRRMRFPRKVMYLLWGIAFLRLVMPFAFAASWSLYNITGGVVQRLITLQEITGVAGGENLLVMNMIGAAEQYAPLTYRTETLRQVFVTASLVWAIIAAALVITLIVLYRLTRKELRGAEHVRDNIYRSEMLLSPVIIGVFRPRIIIPPSLDPDSEEGRMIIAHERTHQRRLDNLWRLIAIVITCLHWFNPLCWVMLKSFLTDMEHACDEAVVRGYDAERRKKYAGLLLNFAQNRMLISTAFGSSAVKVRIVNVLNYKKLTLMGALASAAFILTVAAVLLTNPPA